jgi:hypothetical protein
MKAITGQYEPGILTGYTFIVVPGNKITKLDSEKM